MKTLHGRSARVGLLLALTLLVLLGAAARTPTGAPASLLAQAGTGAGPSAGWSLHIDAKLHFPTNPELVAHHYCKAVAGGVTECQLYDGDAADARLAGVEAVVDAATYAGLNVYEQQLWHYHKTEIPRVSATLPDLSPEQAAQVAASLEETYGKIYIFWDVSQNTPPLGQPAVTLLPR